MPGGAQCPGARGALTWSLRFFLERLPVQSLMRRMRAFRVSFLAASSARALDFLQGRVKDAYWPGSLCPTRDGTSRSEAKDTRWLRLAGAPKYSSQRRVPEAARPRRGASGERSRSEDSEELWWKGLGVSPGGKAAWRLGSGEPGAGKGPSGSLPSAWPQGESYQEDSELSELPLLERGRESAGEGRGLGARARGAGAGA